MRPRSLLPILFLAPILGLAAQPASDRAEVGASRRPATELSARNAVVLGAIEGLIEYLPVSSVGHVMVANHLLGLESTAQLRDAQGRPLWIEPPAGDLRGVPLTLKVAADTFNIVTQIGAIAAVALLYWRRFAEIGRGLAGRSEEGRRLLRNLLVAFFPVGIVGFLFNRWIVDHLFSIGAFVSAQLVGAALMLAAERWRQGRPEGERRDLSRLPAPAALKIGLLQVASLWPGMSRSMTTIVGGYFVGLDRRQAGEFSFLLGFVTLSAAAFFKMFQSGPAMIRVFGWPHVLLGGAAAATAAVLAIRLFLRYLGRHGLAAFAFYRLAFAGFLAAFFLR